MTVTANSRICVSQRGGGWAPQQLNCWEVVGLKIRVVLLKLAAKCPGASQEGCYR